jgi:hypothetical protein
MNHNIIDERPIWSVMGQGIACVKTSRYVMSPGIGKTFYQIGMVFNTGSYQSWYPGLPLYTHTTQIETIQNHFISENDFYFYFHFLVKFCL